MEPIVNRVAESEIMVLDPAAFRDEAPIVEFDLAPFLFKGLVLREKEFRAQVKEHDWSVYADAHVAAYCSTDAIIPTWAYLLIVSHLQGIALDVMAGRAGDAVRRQMELAVQRFDWSVYEDKIVVIKGCGGQSIPTDLYVQIMARLQTVARKLMYGEPCSSVPLWRRLAARHTEAPAGVKAPLPATEAQR